MPISISLPSQTSPAYCTDEDIAVRAAGDMVTLCPPWQVMATGTDGVFASGFPWVLTSASVNFQSNGVQPNGIVVLSAPKANFPGGGHLLAIDSVTSSSITLRRLHQDLNVGQPPAPAAGLTGVAFSVPTLGPQIEEATFDIKRRFAIDENVPYRASTWIYTVRDLRQATILTVLVDRYTQECRSDKGDFALKLKRFAQILDDTLARVQVRWGALGTSSPPTDIFNARISR